MENEPRLGLVVGECIQLLLGQLAAVGFGVDVVVQSNDGSAKEICDFILFLVNEIMVTARMNFA